MKIPVTELTRGGARARDAAENARPAGMSGVRHVARREFSSRIVAADGTVRVVTVMGGRLVPREVWAAHDVRQWRRLIDNGFVIEEPVAL